MAAKKNEKRDEVFQALREAIGKYGLEAGPKLVREAYPDVPNGTWYRWLREISASPKEVAVQKARKAARNLPAAPPPEYIAEKPAEARRNIDFMSRLENLYSDAEMLREFSVTKTEDGEKIRVPLFFEKSIRLRADLLDSALQALAQVWDLQRMQRLHDLILQEIGKADPETQKRITAALKELDDKVGITMEARL